MVNMDTMPGGAAGGVGGQGGMGKTLSKWEELEERPVGTMNKTQFQQAGVGGANGASPWGGPAASNMHGGASGGRAATADYGNATAGSMVNYGTMGASEMGQTGQQGGGFAAAGATTTSFGVTGGTGSWGAGSSGPAAAASPSRLSNGRSPHGTSSAWVGGGGGGRGPWHED